MVAPATTAWLRIALVSEKRYKIIHRIQIRDLDLAAIHLVHHASCRVNVALVLLPGFIAEPEFMLADPAVQVDFAVSCSSKHVHIRPLEILVAGNPAMPIGLWIIFGICCFHVNENAIR